MVWIERLVEEDMKWDFEQAQYRAIQAYKRLQEKDTYNPLLRFAEITQRGLWIFKKEEIKIVKQFEQEFSRLYSPGPKRYPLSFDSYAFDLEKAVGSRSH